MIKSRLFLLSALTLAVSACTTLPKAPTTVLAEPNLPIDSTYALANDSTTTSSIAAKRWQDFYGDEKLKALIELGLANNKDLEQATLAIQKAAAAYQITRSDSFPSINTSTGYTREGNRNTSAGSYNVGLAMASYELDLWGRIASLKEQALQNYLASNAAKDTVQISLISNIAQSYANISYAKAQLLLAQSTVASRERSLYITERRFQAGIDSKSPSLQAESSLENARLAVLTAQTSLLKAQNALQLLLGSPIPPELMPEPAITGIIADNVLSTGLPSELLFYRPDIAQAEYQLKAAGANINAARANFFPSISLSGSLGTQSSDLSDLFSSNVFSWRFGPTISLPIFDAGARRANYEVAQIEQQQALAAYESAIQTAFKEVSDVLATRTTLGEQLNSQYKLQQNYQQTYDIAYATFRSGLSNYLDVLDAERSLFSVQQSILQLELERVISQIELYQALGGGASLSAEQIVPANTQAAAMVSARIATDSEVAALSGERSPTLPIIPASSTAPSLGINHAANTDSTPVETPNLTPNTP